MKPVRQTKRGGADVPAEERGDCWDACLASILEVPIAAVPVPHSDDPEVSWWGTSQAALAPHGYQAIRVDAREYRTYWIAVVPSRSLGPGVMHVVVMHGDTVAHDPCIGDRYETGTSMYDIDVRDAYLLVPLVVRSVAA